MGHNDGADDAHGLQQLLSPTAWAAGQENALQHLHLPWPHQHVLGSSEKGHCELPAPYHGLVAVGTPCGSVPCQPCRKRVVPSSRPHLIAKGQGHDHDEEAEESLQFAEP